MTKIYQIAIDGPVGAGKSTVAKKVADKLGILYIDTGAMYRVVALYAKEEHIDWHDEKKVSGLLDKVKIQLTKPADDEIDGRNVTVKMNGQDVSWEIRGADLGEGASIVSQYKSVRKNLVSLQQSMARGESVIMEGRDIGTKVLPNADLKIYMDADVDERVLRKIEQMKKMGVKVKPLDAKNDLIMRDNREMTRKIDPLRPAEGAWILDTSDLSVSQVVAKIASRVASK